MDTVTVRVARSGELHLAAELRWRWILENEAMPDMPRSQFVAAFTAWAEASATTHHCILLFRNETAIGMAWLAVVARVPSPRSFVRASGDLQSVYVVPEQRNAGLGGQMIAFAHSLADSIGLERVTVHSSPDAIGLYSRAGYEASPRLRQLPLG